MIECDVLFVFMMSFSREPPPKGAVVGKEGWWFGELVNETRELDFQDTRRCFISCRICFPAHPAKLESFALILFNRLFDSFCYLLNAVCVDVRCNHFVHSLS